MINLYETFKFKFPNARLFVDYEIRDDDLVEWNVPLLGPRPTDEQIAQYRIEAQQAKDASTVANQQERTNLIALRDKLQAGGDLTAPEMRAVLRFLIRRELLR